MSKLWKTTLGTCMIVAGDTVVFYLLPPDAVAYVVGVHAVLLAGFGVALIGSAWDK